MAYLPFCFQNWIHTLKETASLRASYIMALTFNLLTKNIQSIG